MTTAKEIIFEEDVRNALRKGIDELANIVSITLGPSGYNVGLQMSFGSPLITSDGASIVKDIEVKDPFVNVGISMGKEVASKIKEKSGDGTTTGIVLLRALVQAGLKHVAAGINPMSLKRGLEKALEELLKQIDKKAMNIRSIEETKNIATVSSGSNQEIGKLISSCFEKLGKNGIITIEEGKATEDSLEIVEGMELDRGYISPHFCTNTEKLLVELENPSILITDKKIQSAQEILSILQAVAAKGDSLLIIAEDIDGDALSTLVINKLKGILKVAAIKAPAFGDTRKEILEDIAAITQAEVVSEEKGLLLKEVGEEVLGKVSRIIIGRDKTTFIGAKSNTSEVKNRLIQIDGALKKATSEYDKTKLKERKAKLEGAVAIIKVGALTESEMKKKKQSFEDSLNATRAALEEGVSIGGGMTLIHAARATQVELSKDEEIGAKILMRACEAPFRQIVSNTGYDPSTMLENALKEGPSFGFNALTEKVEDLVKAGIIDPVKVIKASLIHAVSMAGMILITESIIAPEISKA